MASEDKKRDDEVEDEDNEAEDEEPEGDESDADESDDDGDDDESDDDGDDDESEDDDDESEDDDGDDDAETSSEDDASDDDDDDDDDDEAEAPAKPAPTAPAAKASRRAADDDDDDDDDDLEDFDDPYVGKEDMPTAPASSLGKSLILFVVIVGVLAGGFWLLGSSEEAGGRHQPEWKAGDKVDIDFTIVASDQRDLACVSTEEIGGLKCGYSDPNTAVKDLPDENTLRPYTSVDGIEFAAAGVWSQPALAPDKLPKANARFSVKCKYEVKGKLKSPKIRWKPGGWIDNGNDWFAGAVSDCTITK